VRRAFLVFGLVPAFQQVSVVLGLPWAPRLVAPVPLFAGFDCSPGRRAFPTFFGVIFL
jgi:hypothetical protein